MLGIQGVPSELGGLDIPWASQVEKSEHRRSYDMYELLMLLLLLHASCTWY